MQQLILESQHQKRNVQNQLRLVGFHRGKKTNEVPSYYLFERLTRKNEKERCRQLPPSCIVPLQDTELLQGLC